MDNALALVLQGPRRLEATELPIPDIGEDDGLLKVEACGLCGTDHEQYSGLFPHPGAFVPGHETVGVISAIGAAAAERWGVEIGQRVAVEPFQSCRTCAACLAGNYRRCERHSDEKYGFFAATRGLGLYGGYAQYHYLEPDSVLLPIPDGLDPVIATLFNPLGAGIRWAVHMPNTSPGEVVVILGPGVRGLCASAAAKEAGAGFVMMTGAGEKDAERLALGASFGVDLTVDVTKEDPIRALRDATGGLADVVVDVTAAAPAAFSQAIELARHGGRVVIAGVRGTPNPPDFWPDHIMSKELTVLGALGVDVRAYRPAIELLMTGRYPFAELPRRCEGFDGADDLLQAMAGETEGTRPVHGVFVP